jgi:hypothetical protein
MLNDDTLLDVLDNLVDLIEKDPALFHKTYRSLPYETFSEIERLSLNCQKADKQKDVVKKAKIVADAFHKKFNTKGNGRK